MYANLIIVYVYVSEMRILKGICQEVIKYGRETTCQMKRNMVTKYLNNHLIPHVRKPKPLKHKS